MKKLAYTLLVFVFVTSILSAQTNTEVYLFDIDENFNISNPINVSQNPEAYDNQPSFANHNTLLFSSTRNKQTDIKEVNLITKKERWISQTNNGSEYSPLKIPGKNAASSIRLDTDGKQLLYAYDLDNGAYEVLVKDLVIGYHVWFDKNHIVSFVLGEESSLVVSNLKKKTNQTFQKKIGRSLHKIPGTSLISFISKEEKTWKIKSLDPISGKTDFIINTPEGAEDMSWTPDGSILIGKEDTLYKFNPKKDKDWIKISSLAGFNLKGITRLTVSPKGDKIAIVVAETETSLFEKNTIQMGVVVANLDVSLNFYKNIIGMQEVGGFSVDKDFGKKSGLTNGVAFDVKILKLEDSPSANQFKVVSFNKKKVKPSSYIQDDNGVQYITIFVKSVKPFIEKCKANNIPFLGETPTALPDGRLFILIQDPDGTFIELIGGA